MPEADSIEKYTKLVELLYEKIISGNIPWTESLVYDGFELSLAGRILAISKIDKTKGSAPDYEIKILRSSDYGLIDSFRDVDLADLGIPEFGPFTTYYQALKFIYEKVARKLSGADEALDEILKALSD